MSDELAIREGLRALRRKMRSDGVRYSDLTAIAKHAALKLHAESREVFLAYWLDSGLRLIDVTELAVGSSREALVDVSFIARTAAKKSAETAVFVHNHPSGNTTPSDSDRVCVRKINAAMIAIGILPMAHFVVAGTDAEEISTGDRMQLDQA